MSYRAEFEVRVMVVERLEDVFFLDLCTIKITLLSTKHI